MTYYWEHKTLVEAWVGQVLGTKGARPYPTRERDQKHLIPGRDALFSWGTHFPLVVPVRRKARGKVLGWCINGDTWTRSSGWSADNSTHNHQDAVRQVIAATGMPYVVIPFSALRSAGIDPTTVIPVHNTTERWTHHEEVIQRDDRRIEWHYPEHRLPGTGVWVHRTTGQAIAQGWSQDHRAHISEPPGRPRWDTDGYDQHLRDVAKWKAQWEWYPSVYKRNGHRYPQLKRGNGNSEVTLEHRDGVDVFVRRWSRHWLGESVVKARVDYRHRVTCDACKGTKRVDPWVDVFEGGEGPLTEWEDSRHAGYDRILANLEDMPTWKPRPRTTQATRVRTECHRCRTTGRITVGAQRWAYFLSGFDQNEPRPSYFFTELPPREKPTTVAEAYATLKPATVALAEELGRTVHRQGDIYLIETPTLTLRSLKAQGGVHTKRHQKDPRTQIWGDVRLFETNHTASEVVRIGGLTYARGVIRHEPSGRRPDHVRLNVGRSWSLVLTNRTPVGTGL